MTKDYTMRPGKETVISNNRQRMAQSQRDSTQNMVKESQNKAMKYQGKAPMDEARYYKFDACMENNGAHAQELAKKLTADLDKVAFPVRQNVDMSQD